MGDKVQVDVAVPVYGPQYAEWWYPLLLMMMSWQEAGIAVRPIKTTSAMPDTAKNLATTAHMMGNNTGVTSSQRNMAVARGKAEWLFFIDHDTTPPVDALPRLLEHRQPFVAGVYYHRGEPFAPLMYKRVEGGLYKVWRDYEKGALIQADAVGMGCTLIHRDVFESIYKNFIHFQRSNGTSFILHKDDVTDRGLPKEFRVKKPMVFRNEHGWHKVEPLQPLQVASEEKQSFPFYSMEEGRTEDIVFCEHAERVGFKPLIDTSIECRHWHPIPVTGEVFYGYRRASKLAGDIPTVIEEVV